MKRVTIRGRYFNFRRVALRDWGEINDAPKAAEREIRIRRSATGFAELDTTIHECLHAAYPDLNERAVDGAASDIATVLWRMGYRRKTGAQTR